MKKRVFAVIMAMTLVTSVFTGCGKEAGEAQSTSPAVENQVEQSTVADEPTETATEAETSDDGMKQLEAIGDVDVDKGLFNVTLTIPKDFVGETTQEKLDESVKEKGYKSATLNSDGSVTYVMTKAQHEEMLVGIRESIDKSLSEMIGSSDYPNITNVEHNDNYTSFTITTKNAEPDMSESFSVMALYMYGGMYGIFSGEEVDNVHVDFKNADSGEIISSANSEDMGSDSE
ncbi:MAG: hypothetical protein J6X66_04600 [Lachnospiraceae bacterium]|nr:hypothetical protein [Lachnospiraceae bacterium]